jgi:hypothetical protein
VEKELEGKWGGEKEGEGLGRNGMGKGKEKKGMREEEIEGRNRRSSELWRFWSEIEGK